MAIWSAPLLVLGASIWTSSVLAASLFPKFKHLVTFGDSYTDEGRYAYMLSHNNTLPPKGYVPPVSNTTTTGGYIWPRMIANATGITLHNYAVSGAVCSLDLTPRPFPDVKGYEVPAFLTDFTMGKAGAGSHTNGGTGILDPDETLFTLWIGTNDLGPFAILDDSAQPGVTLVNTSACAIYVIQTLYDHGARNFVFQNLVPLYLAPQYATDARFGVGVPNHYFWTKESVLNGNNTAISDKMREEVLAVNEIWKYRLPALASKMPGAKLAMFDSFDLIWDIIFNPAEYLTTPYNTTGYISHCTISDDCVSSWLYDAQDWNGFVWYDELHPSERTDHIVADEIIKTMAMKSKYATYYF